MTSQQPPEGLSAELHWNGEFRVRDPDPADDHGPIYLQCPDGLLVNFSCHATPGVDARRVEWVAQALNAARSTSPEGLSAEPAGLDVLDDLVRADDILTLTALRALSDQPSTRRTLERAIAAMRAARSTSPAPDPKAVVLPTADGLREKVADLIWATVDQARSCRPDEIAEVRNQATTAILALLPTSKDTSQ